ncbi:hypothetical protein ACFXDE_30100 [Kitasatospora sp. NPDC059408]|uniref:hypothetical protein n=1 Tax=Kitasatospora sp. NPDC059408 TaxID=3346823 RepID=UPI003682C188
MPAWLSRPFLVALFALPLLAVVLLSAPAWLTWPFLPPGRQDVVLAVLDRLVQWTRVAVPRVSGPATRAVVE